MLTSRFDDKWTAQLNAALELDAAEPLQAAGHYAEAVKNFQQASNTWIDRQMYSWMDG